MSKKYNLKVTDYVTESGALVFVNGATRPLSDGSMHRRANTGEVARKILSIDKSNIVLAHVVYGPTDLITLVHTSSVEQRHTVVSRIRALRNSPEHRDNFVADAVSQPIISMYGRSPTRSDWSKRKHYGAWLLAKVSETGPADDLALYFFEL